MAKSRWFIIDNPDNECSKHTMALIDSIQTVERKEENGKFYVRFTVSNKKTTKFSNLSYRFTINSHIRQRRPVSNNIRHYCAVMLKDDK